MSEDVMVAQLHDRITIKRRRDEEPVDGLYVQRSKKTKPNNVLWTRLPDEVTYQTEVVPPEQDHFVARVAQDENGPTEVCIPAASQKDSQADPRVSCLHARLYRGTVPNNPKVASGRIERSRPRKAFNSSSNSKVGLAELLTQVKQQDHTGKIPLLSNNAERATDQRHKHPRASTPASDAHIAMNASAMTAKSSDRKRPIVNGAEAARRKASYQREMEQPKDKPPPRSTENLRDPRNMFGDLTLKMQNFAIEESQLSANRSTTSEGQPKLKFKPKLPRPRHLNQDGGNTLSDAEEHVEDDVNYVYDIFVRSQPEQLRTEGSEKGPVPTEVSTGVQNVAILVLGFDDEDFEHGLGDIESSEEEWSGDDDENGIAFLSEISFTADRRSIAEDHFANDYPDEETSSDDDHSDGQEDDASEDDTDYT